jgi:hypothetical protein
MFSGIEFYLFPRGKLPFFRFRLGCFFVTRVYFSNIPIGVSVLPWEQELIPEYGVNI